MAVMALQTVNFFAMIVATHRQTQKLVDGEKSGNNTVTNKLHRVIFTDLKEKSNIYTMLNRMKVLKSFVGLMVLILGIINYVLAICYMSTYRSMYEDIDMLQTSMAMGEISLSPIAYSFDILAYYNIFAIIGIVMLCQLFLVVEFLYFAAISLSAVFCTRWRLRRSQERAGVPTDSYDHYVGEFDFEVTDELLQKIREKT